MEVESKAIQHFEGVAVWEFAKFIEEQTLAGFTVAGESDTEFWPKRFGPGYYYGCMVKYTLEEQVEREIIVAEDAPLLDRLAPIKKKAELISFAESVVGIEVPKDMKTPLAIKKYIKLHIEKVEGIDPYEGETIPKEKPPKQEEALNED